MDWFNSASTLTKAMITAGVLLALLIVAAFATHPGDSESTATRSPIASQQSLTAASNNSQVQTVVVREDAGGYTNNDLTPETMKLIENELVKRTILRGQEHMVSQGFAPKDISPDMVQSSSWVMDAEGKRFGIVEMLAGMARIKAIVSIEGTQFVRVSCVDPTGKNVPISTGPCADKIHEVFGIHLPTTN